MPPFILAFPSGRSSSNTWPSYEGCSAIDTTSLRLSLIPSTPQDVEMNSLIHRAACSISFDTVKARALLSSEVLVLALPPHIRKLLSCLNEASFDTAILEILALIAEDEGSFDSLDGMVEEKVWERLQQYVTNRIQAPHGLEHAGLISAVETLLHAAESSSTWIIQIPFLYVVPAAADKIEKHETCDKSEDYGRPTRKQRRRRAVESVMRDAFSVWRLVHASAARIGVDPLHLSKILCHAVGRGNGAPSLPARNLCLEMIAGSRRPYQSRSENLTPLSLPGDLVEQQLVPLVFLSMVESL